MITLILIGLSTVAAVVPMVGFLAAIWWMDRYDREPIWLITLTFSWGAIGAIFLGILGSLILMVPLGIGLAQWGAAADVDTTGMLDQLSPVLIAPLAEEPAKAIVLLAVIFSRHFDNMTDGFVYGAAAGLGFGMTENFLYFITVVDDPLAWGGTVVIRTFYSAVMHATATAMVGACLGFARFRGLFWLAGAGVVGLGAGGAIHAAWNGLITGAQWYGHPELFWFDILMLPAVVAAVFVVFQICLATESANIRRELGDEVAHGRMPDSHPPIIASWTRRMLQTNWLDAHIEKHRYIEEATLLAMRKQQLRLMGKRAPPFYADEVTRLQQSIAQQLEPG
jgi:protease PrsW